MNVAAEKPNSPRIDGAAIGCRNTRAWLRHSLISPGAPFVDVTGRVPVLITNLLK
jgi:hypothetical protein